MHRNDIFRAAGSRARISLDQSSRRMVLKWSGAAMASALVLKVSDAFAADLPENFDAGAGGVDSGAAQTVVGAVDLGGGDIGVLNYAYALEQLEAAFYTEVVASPYRGINDYELALLTDIRDHEVTHREFLKGALGGKRIPDLEVDFSAVNFNSRKSVLTTARTFEDLGVSAYNGAGQLLRNPDFLVAAGRIVSVEARHAAVIRNVLAPFSEAFAGDDVVDENGLDVVRLPSEVLPAADPFVATPVSANQLP